MLNTLNAWECLEQLLDYGQFELLNFDQITPTQDHTDCRAIYLMNDTVESFIVFRNARYTGTYLENYAGDITYTLDKNACVLRINQNDRHLLLFFDSLEMETHLYDYGGIGHFWVSGYENLRNLEFQIAVIRDKYDFLGPASCNELEQKLATLKNFPPLNYLFYPATPSKYITEMENPWFATEAALNFFENICISSNDEKLANLTRAYRRKPCKRRAIRISKLLRHTRHKAVPDYIFELICKAASQYPRRSFGAEIDLQNQALLNKASLFCQSLSNERQTARVYREEPFENNCDDITFKVYVMTLRDGVWKRHITVQQLESHGDRPSGTTQS